MVHRPKPGLGDARARVAAFDALRPYAEQLARWRAGFPISSPDWMALGVAWDGLATAAYHFTRRRYFYADVETAEPPSPPDRGLPAGRDAAVAAFRGLQPHVTRLRQLMDNCQPMGRDWLALMIALECLETAAFHFTKVPSFFGASAESFGPARGGAVPGELRPPTAPAAPRPPGPDGSSPTGGRRRPRA